MMSNGVFDLISPDRHEVIVSQIEKPGAERNVISYVIHNPNEVYDVVSKLKEDDFNNSLNRTIFQIISRLSEKGATVSVDNILAVAAGNKALSNEGEQYLDILSKADTSGIDLNYNIELVKASSIKRKTYRAALAMMSDCVNNQDDEATSFLGKQQTRLMDISLRSGSDKVIHIAEGLDTWLLERKNNPTKVPGLRTGFPDLDEAIGGFRPGRFYVFAARSKVGKSLLLNNFALHIAAKEKQPILYLDTEMATEDDVRPRLLAILSGIDEDMITNGTYINDEESVERVEFAASVLNDTPFFHAYIPNFSRPQLVSLVRKYHVKEGIKALFFDYIKMPMNSTNALAEYQELGFLTAALKDVCGELKIPGITAAQLNRSGIKTNKDDFTEDDFHEGMIGGSDRILQNASYLFYLWGKTDKQIMDDGGPDAGNMVLKLGNARHKADYLAWLKKDDVNGRIIEVHKL